MGYNQYTVKKLNVGEVYEDFEIKELLYKKVKDKNIQYYRVKCIKCGREKTMLKKYLKNFVGTNHQSCGNSVAPADKRFYRIWQGMRSRTTNKNQKSYKSGYYKYSSDDYKYFIDFYDDMWESYVTHVNMYGEENTTLDREDNKKGYLKGNLRWTTRKNQSRNTERIRKCEGISPDGKMHIFTVQVDFAKEHGLNKNNINGCLRGKRKTHKGWKFRYIE